MAYTSSDSNSESGSGSESDKKAETSSSSDTASDSSKDLKKGKKKDKVKDKKNDKKKEKQKIKKKGDRKSKKVEKKNSAAKTPKYALVIWVETEEYSILPISAILNKKMLYDVSIIEDLPHIGSGDEPVAGWEKHPAAVLKIGTLIRELDKDAKDLVVKYVEKQIADKSDTSPQTTDQVVDGELAQGGLSDEEKKAVEKEKSRKQKKVDDKKQTEKKEEENRRKRKLEEEEKERLKSEISSLKEKLKESKRARQSTDDDNSPSLKDLPELVKTSVAEALKQIPLPSAKGYEASKLPGSMF